MWAQDPIAATLHYAARGSKITWHDNYETIMGKDLILTENVPKGSQRRQIIGWFVLEGSLKIMLYFLLLSYTYFPPRTD